MNDNRDFTGQLVASLETAPVKTFYEIQAAMLALKADCKAYNAGKHPLADDYSDAVAGLCDVLGDASVEFEAEIPTTSGPAEQHFPNNQKAV